MQEEIQVCSPRGCNWRHSSPSACDRSSYDYSAQFFAYFSETLGPLSHIQVGFVKAKSRTKKNIYIYKKTLAMVDYRNNAPVVQVIINMAIRIRI